MQKNINKKDIRVFGYVLRRTNYGEADRILNIITPEGKKAVIARGVRKEKSKLAGGIEIFSLTDFNIHFGKSEFGVVTGARMVSYYGEIIKDLRRMELAGAILKMVDRAAEYSDSPEFFTIVDQCLKALNNKNELNLVEAWFLLNLRKAKGEEVNLYRDKDGEKLSENEKYDWDAREEVFYKKENGEFGVNEIKMLRLMVANNLEVTARVRLSCEVLDKVWRLAKTIDS